ncbi:MAG: RNA polymerase sigma-70 factor [Bacteroides graminisolvens]|nr:RNA polymerase sigma-70 factor [Bacteroides graminisolvens]
MPTNDILFLQLIKQDDEKAFKYLFDTYFVPLCRFMALYLKDRQEVEELALTIFMNLWENRATLILKISFKAYLFQAARNRCLNALRDKKKTVSIEESEEYAYDLSTETSVEMEELNRLIEEAVYSLSDRCRQVYRKSREESKTNQQIAEEMDISVKTVEAQITKALKHIKKFLGEQYAYLF